MPAHKLLSELVSALSESKYLLKPVHTENPDMRTTRCRKLKSVCHGSHIGHKYVRRSSKYGDYKTFTTKEFSNALTLTDKEFNKLINALAIIKKFNL